jgi:Fe-S-cluster containining protein
MVNASSYDCQQCGACCSDTHGGEGYASLDRTESKRMKRLGLHVIAISGGASLGTRVQGGRSAAWVCVAFQGEIGRDCGCSIYQDRPSVCRRFEVGSVHCRKARAETGLPV